MRLAPVGLLAACSSSTADPQLDADPGEAGPGYTLFSPSGEARTYLIDDAGAIVHQWTHDVRPGLAVVLLDDGDLLRAGAVPGTGFAGGGAGGRIDRLSWDGAVEWSFGHPGQHHDFEVLPGGTIVMLSWEVKSRDQALTAGFDPARVPATGVWSERVVEVDPSTDTIIWEWRAWDHLAQDRDPAAGNYVATVADHPDRLDVDVAGETDLFHVNALDHHAGRDQLLLSSRVYSELWVIDRGSGELVHRWGNPQVWGGGGPDDRQLFFQHDAQWIDDGSPGAGGITVFDNGHVTLRPYSRVLELSAPPAFDPIWQYQDPAAFFAPQISGAQRLPDGTTQICDGPAGRFFRVTPDGEVIWSYQHGAATFRAERYELPASLARIDA